MRRLHSIRFKKAYAHGQRKNKKESERVYERNLNVT